MGLTRSASADRDGDRMAGADRSGRRGGSAIHARILLVGDEADARGALETRLRAEGFAVSTAPDGEAALADATRAPPDLVLTDLQMQPIDGVEAVPAPSRDRPRSARHRHDGLLRRAVRDRELARGGRGLPHQALAVRGGPPVRGARDRATSREARAGGRSTARSMSAWW